MGFFHFWTGIPRQRRKRLILYFIGVVVVLGTLWAARSVLGLYLIGLLLAYILSPVVDLLQRAFTWVGVKTHLGFVQRAARSFSILLTYLLLLAVVAGFMALVVPVIVREARDLWEQREAIWDEATRVGERLIEQYEVLPERVRMQIDDTLSDLSTIVTRALQQAVQGTFSAITYTTSLVLAISIVPFWTFYLLRDAVQLQRSVINAVPSGAREDLLNLVRLLDVTVGAYLRGQIVLSIIMGVLTTIVMSALGLDYALLLGVLAGLLESIPNLGPTLAGIPAILLGLTISPLRALLAAVAANLLQNIENSLIVPRVLGDTMGLHPVVMMVMLVIGTEIAGLPGLFLAPIMTAVLRDLYRYFNYRFADVPVPPDMALRRVLTREQFQVDL